MLSEGEISPDRISDILISIIGLKDDITVIILEGEISPDRISDILTSIIGFTDDITVMISEGEISPDRISDSYSCRASNISWILDT